MRNELTEHMNETSQERRIRFAAEMPIHVSREGGVVEQVIMRDIGPDGFCVEAKLDNLTVGETVGVEVPADEERGRITAIGELRWTDKGVAGLRLVGMLPNHRRRFEHLLESLEDEPYDDFEDEAA